MLLYWLAEIIIARVALHYVCPVYSLTGLLCSGCGSTRALRSIFAGNIALAWRQNLLFVLMFAALLWQGLTLLLQRCVKTETSLPRLLRPVSFSSRDRRCNRRNYINPKLLWPLLGVALIFMIVRNLDIPLAVYLRP